MAKLIKKPISNLTILFLFSILIPGFILAYFSIQTIANQKELTEKKLLEDQNQSAKEFAEYFEQNLQNCADEFFQNADSLYDKTCEAFSSINTMAFVSQAFIIDNRGQFIYPHYSLSTTLKPKHGKSSEFSQLISKAEKFEFAESNLKAATQLYQDAIKISKNKTEGATAINGLARVYVKRNFKNQALNYYRILAARYGSIIDNTNLPFAYYSMHQMIQMSFSRNTNQLATDIDNILSLIIKGQIVLSDNTAFLLHEIEQWLENQKEISTNLSQRLSQKISSIQKLLFFVQYEGILLQQNLQNRYHSTAIPRLGQFLAITGKSENKPVLLIFKPTSDNFGFLGFQVDLIKLKEQTLNFSFKQNYSFTPNIEIIPGSKVNQMALEPFCTIKELSPLVPWWRICILPQNTEIVNKYISRRRLIYGITLTFLITGMFLGVVLVLRDVSREQRLVQLRSDFVSNVSHELKTPLTSIRMFAETMLLGRVKKKSEQQEYLSIIVNETERLTRLINTVLDFSKIEKGKKQYFSHPANISQVIHSAIDTMEQSIKEKGFTLLCDIETNVKTVADSDAIEQAVLNLLSNAIKYSNNKKEISVKLWAENESIFIEVVDKGIGIPESEKKRIFDKFYRAHIGHKKDTGGAGLGLTVVKHIVDAHQGKIELESRVGEGSKFTIIMPQIRNNNEGNK